MGRRYAALAAGMLALACKGEGDMGWQRPGPPPRAGVSDAAGDGTQRAERASTDGVGVVAGRVAAARPGEVVVESTERPEIALRISGDTRIAVDGQPAAASQLAPGVEVRASFEQRGGRATALSIEALPDGVTSAAVGADRTSPAARGVATPNGAHGAQGSAPGAAGRGNPGAPRPVP